MTNCLKDYIGIRGECNNATLYLDDLPGIDFIKASKFTNPMLKRPMDIVNKAFGQAQKEVIKDVLSLINCYNYNSIINEKQYNYAGNYTYYGEVDKTVKIKATKSISDRFVNLRLFNLEIVSDRQISKDFIVTDGYGFEETLTVELEKGINYIDIDYTTKSEYLSIEFNLSDFKIGMKEYSNCDECSSIIPSCSTCIVSCQDCSNLVVELDGSYTYKIGLNIIVRCEADECQLLKSLIPSIDVVLLYKTAILYLLEIKLSENMNAYVRNSKDDIEQILALYMGGYDNQNQTNIPSMYWQKVKQLSSSINNIVCNLDTSVFSYNGSRIINTLP